MADEEKTQAPEDEAATAEESPVSEETFLPASDEDPSAESEKPEDMKEPEEKSPEEIPADEMPTEETPLEDVEKPAVETESPPVTETEPSSVPETGTEPELPEEAPEAKKEEAEEEIKEEHEPKEKKEEPEAKEKKEIEVKRLFDSKGSLMESESFIKEKLEEFKGKRAGVAIMIGELQAKVKEYKGKENPTDDDIANLKKYHTTFLEKLSEYEKMTRTVERLMGMADIPTSQLDMTMSGPPITKPLPVPEKPSQVDTFPEEKLPKLIVCGTDMGDHVPRIIVCEPLRRADLEPFHKDSPKSESADVEMMRKLNESFDAQKKLAAENAQMAQIRQQLQEELLDKQELLDSMKQRMMTLESEKYKIMTENTELQRQIQQAQRPVESPGLMCKRELYMKYRGQSPDARSPRCLKETTQDLEQELERMDGDVKNICSELENLQREKISLGFATSPKRPFCKRMLPQKSTQTEEDGAAQKKDVIFQSDIEPKYKDLSEQYQRVVNDFQNKVSEVASLRVQLDGSRKQLEDKIIAELELRTKFQKELDENQILKAELQQAQTYKNKVIDLEQQANIAKQMYKSSQEDTDEMRSLIEEQATQLDEYRHKYMQTLQIAEELKRENEFKERECANQITFEIQRVKLEMQEQLEELSPIKDLLKITQNKLKETEQMHTVALDNIASMSQQLQDAKNEIDTMKHVVNAVEASGDLQENLQHSLEMAEKQMTMLEAENADLKEKLGQFENLEAQQSKKLEEKFHEILQMTSQLETLREESARQVTKVKDKSDMIKKCLQAQITDLEREVAQCRAAAAFANRERDEVRSKLQLEICLLSENFRESQNRIMQLQQHVNYLSASHPTSLIDLVQ